MEANVPPSTISARWHFMSAYGKTSLLTLGLALAGQCLGDGVEAAPAPQSDPIELAIPTKKTSLLWMYTTVLFVTNRKEAGNDSNDSDQLFTNVSDTKISLGEACVAYPTNRRPAEQDYSADGDLEAPAKFFTVKGFLPLGPQRDFQLALDNQSDLLFERECPKENGGAEATPTLFIHGWRSSFTAGITRATQLKLDLNRKSVIVLSWPADQDGNVFQNYIGAGREEGKACHASAIRHAIDKTIDR